MSNVLTPRVLPAQNAGMALVFLHTRWRQTTQMIVRNIPARGHDIMGGNRVSDLKSCGRFI